MDKERNRLHLSMSPNFVNTDSTSFKVLCFHPRPCAWIKCRSAERQSFTTINLLGQRLCKPQVGGSSPSASLLIYSSLRLETSFITSSMELLTQSGDRLKDRFDFLIAVAAPPFLEAECFSNHQDNFFARPVFFPENQEPS